MNIAKVAVEAATYSFDKAFDYRVPSELVGKVMCGSRVVVPFGNGNKKCIGFIFATAEKSENKRLKKITEVIDDEPLLSDEMIRLAGWIKDRTFCTLYEAAKAMLPTGMNHRMIASYAANRELDSSIISRFNEEEKEIYDYLYQRGIFVKADNIFKALGRKTNTNLLEKLAKKDALIANVDAVRNVGDPTVRMVRLFPDYNGVKFTKKQKEVIDVLCDVGEASVKEICYFTGLTPAVINTLAKNGAVELYDQQVISLPDMQDIVAEKEEIKLTQEQQKAFLGLKELAGSGEPSVSLPRIPPEPVMAAPRARTARSSAPASASSPAKPSPCAMWMAPV